MVPPENQDFCQVYSKARATSLPPHHSYHCGINLLPGTTPPQDALYPLSEPEPKAMDINVSLAAGLILPSFSPAGARFFFVSKKDGTLRPSIDYCGLNSITIKNWYPLPLIMSAFELLQESTIFTKLDLRNAYHRVHIRVGYEWKTAFNTPTEHYKYLIMLFGLTMPQFNFLMNDILQDMRNRFVFFYLGVILIDILISKTRKDHTHHVQLVLKRLQEKSLYVKA